jgi:hypothetical protein
LHPAGKGTSKHIKNLKDTLEILVHIHTKKHTTFLSENFNDRDSSVGLGTGQACVAVFQY